MSWKFLSFWITFRFFKWCINRSENTKWKPKTYKGSRDKNNNAKIKGCRWHQLLHLILKVILCSKFNYSDVTSIKPPLSQSFLFLFFYRENLRKIEKILSRCVHTHQSWPSSCAHPYAFVMTTPSPTCVSTLWMAPKVISEYKKEKKDQK